MLNPEGSCLKLLLCSPNSTHKRSNGMTNVTYFAGTGDEVDNIVGGASENSFIV